MIYFGFIIIKTNFNPSLVFTEMYPCLLLNVGTTLYYLLAGNVKCYHTQDVTLDKNSLKIIKVCLGHANVHLSSITQSSPFMVILIFLLYSM